MSARQPEELEASDFNDLPPMAAVDAVADEIIEKFHQVSPRSPKGINLKRKVPLAPMWMSCVSAICYIYLWFRGLSHFWRSFAYPWKYSVIAATPAFAIDAPAIWFDIMCMTAVYAVETFLALAFNRSTLLGWRRLDFVAHHLPFVAVVGIGLGIDPEITFLFARTLPLCLLTSLNESIACARAVGASQIIDLPNRFYMLVIMALLLVAEIAEATYGILMPPAESPRFTRLICFLCLGAPVYHGLVVLPHSWKVVSKIVKGWLSDKQHAA